MKTIASREFGKKPKSAWKTLKKEGAVIVTRNGQPEGLMLSTSPETCMDDFRTAILSRAKSATLQLRQSAIRNDVTSLTMADIDQEVHAIRTKRKK